MFVNALRPPMEAGRRADKLGPRLQRAAAGELGVFELLDTGEMLVEECSVGQWPEIFGGLQFGRLRGQKEQPTRGGLDEAEHVAPNKAVLPPRPRPLTDWRKDAPQQRVQADTMLVGRPQLDLGVREGGRHCLQQRSHFFLKLSCCSVLAK